MYTTIKAAKIAAQKLEYPTKDFNKEAWMQNLKDRKIIK